MSERNLRKHNILVVGSSNTDMVTLIPQHYSLTLFISA